MRAGVRGGVRAGVRACERASGLACVRACVGAGVRACGRVSVRACGRANGIIVQSLRTASTKSLDSQIAQKQVPEERFASI